MKIKKNDKVIVLSGKDKGKQGEVRSVLSGKGKVVVSGINMISKCVKPTQDKKGGIEKMEAALDASNVAIVCATCKKGVKISSKALENGDKIRICRTCKKQI